MKLRNEPIGEVECPHKHCTEIAKVFRFRPRGSAKTVFTGKLYCECAKHGRSGTDGNSTVNEYLLEHANIWEPSKGPGASADVSTKSTPAATPATSKTEPTKAESTRTSASESSGRTKPNNWRPLIDLE